ncbi:MAG: hypothetical protein HRU00_15310 [Myxococcales bacterium]|nr:hypothetical protein [Myxococcales bacterium]
MTNDVSNSTRRSESPASSGSHSSAGEDPMTTARLIWRLGALLLITLAAGAAHAQEASSNTVYIQDKLAEARTAIGLNGGETLDLTALTDQANYGDVTAELEIETVDAKETMATAAAIGNSLTVDSPSTMLLVAPQTNAMGVVDASLTLKATHPTEIIEGTAAAIANTLSVTSGTLEGTSSGDLAAIRMRQTSLGDSVTAFQDADAGFGTAEAALTAAAIANSGTLEINGQLDLETLQSNESVVEADLVVGLARVDEFTTMTSAAMGNSLSVLVAAGNLLGDVIQTHEAPSVSAGMEFSTRHTPHGLADISMTAAAIANSASVATSIDADPQLDLVLTQNSIGDVSSWLKSDGPSMAGSNNSPSGAPGDPTGLITATAAAIGNSATIQVQSPVRVK